MLSISNDGRQRASAMSFREVGYFFSEIEVIKKDYFKSLVDRVGYSTQTSCLLQILLKLLG